MTAPTVIPTIVPSVGANRRRLRTLRAPLSGRADPRAIGGLSWPSGVLDQGGTTIYVYPTPPGVQVSRGGGAIIVSAPLKVIFWGHGWTLDSTTPSMVEVMAAIRAIVASPYLEELSQYGFRQIDSIDFYQVLADPPGPSYTGSDVEAMVWGAIDAGAFPEPDESGGRNIYMVFTHAGTSYANKDIDAAGAHADPSDYDFPFDIDYAWVGWVDFGTTLDEITSVFTHELVEMISDPEPESPGWITNQPSPLSEIGDICHLQNGPVGDYAAAAYYSARLGKCVVPSTGLRRHIQLTEKDQQVGQILVTRGQTAADGRSDCLKGTYHWTLFSQTRRAVISADVSSYAHHELTWTVNGKRIFGGENLHVPVDDSSDPLSEITILASTTGQVAVDLPFQGTQLTLTCPADTGMVMLIVSCTAKEAGSDYAGYPTGRTDTLNVFLSGRTRYMEPRFTKDRGSCLIRRLAQIDELIGRYIDKGDPIPPWVERSLAALAGEAQALELNAERLIRGLRDHLDAPPDPALTSAGEERD